MPVITHKLGVYDGTAEIICDGCGKNISDGTQLKPTLLIRNDWFIRDGIVFCLECHAPQES